MQTWAQEDKEEIYRNTHTHIGLYGNIQKQIYKLNGRIFDIDLSDSNLHNFEQTKSNASFV